MMMKMIDDCGDEDDDNVSDIEIDGSCCSSDDSLQSSNIKPLLKPSVEIIQKPKLEICKSNPLSFFVCPSSDTDQSDEDDSDNWDSPTPGELQDLGDFTGLCISGLYIPPSGGGSTLCSSPVSSSFDNEMLLDIDDSSVESISTDDDIVFTDQQLRLDEVNARWQLMFPSQGSVNGSCDVSSVVGSAHKKTHKTVSFMCDDVQLIPVLNESLWHDDYSAARVGQWKQIAADRHRFHKRIHDVITRSVGYFLKRIAPKFSRKESTV